MSKTADFLFELGCEELPTHFSADLKTRLAQALEQAQLSHGGIQAYSTPRRLAVYVKDLLTNQPEQSIERRGPAVASAFDTNSEPTPACIGFAKSCGVDPQQLERINTDKGEWLVYKTTQPGQPAKNLLPELLAHCIKAIPIPKPMRWGAEPHRFARPVHWLLILLDSQVILTELFGIKSNNLTYGHRFHHPEAITIAHPNEYITALESAYVLVDRAARIKLIKKQIQDLAQKHHYEVPIDQDLLEEIANLVEYPVALNAQFDKDFLSVPTQALVASMRDHQKAFACYQDNQLTNYFIFVSNLNSKNPERVIQGNQRVMRARLSDAQFFYQQDLKLPLNNYIEKTKSVIFQRQLGNLYDKAQRISRLAEQLSPEPMLAKRAGELSQFDLVTTMVREFPELQGIMGSYYAKAHGEPDAVALALKEIYLPLPSSQTGSAIALAERLDLLVGIFSIGKKPTGMKDPFKCRRAALGIIRILIENNINLDLVDCLTQAWQGYTDFDKAVISEVHGFILDRLKAYYQDKNIHVDVLNSVLASQNTQLADLHQRILAVDQFRQLPESTALAVANKRVAKLLMQADLKNYSAVDTALLKEPAEKKLAQAMANQSTHKAYSDCLNQLAQLKEPVDNFFDTVMVNIDDEKLKQNRLALLAQLRSLFLQVADISKLQS